MSFFMTTRMNKKDDIREALLGVLEPLYCECYGLGAWEKDKHEYDEDVCNSAGIRKEIKLCKEILEERGKDWEEAIMVYKRIKRICLK